MERTELIAPFNIFIHFHLRWVRIAPIFIAQFVSIKRHKTIRFLIKFTMITKKDTIPYTRIAPFN